MPQECTATETLRRPPIRRPNRTAQTEHRTAAAGQEAHDQARSTALALAAGVCAAAASIFTKLALDGDALPTTWAASAEWPPLVRARLPHASSSMRCQVCHVLTDRPGVVLHPWGLPASSSVVQCADVDSVHPGTGHLFVVPSPYRRQRFSQPTRLSKNFGRCRPPHLQRYCYPLTDPQPI